jgi:hypothetical protein
MTQTKSVELVGKTYSSGLTPSEQALIKAQQSVRINAITASQFKMSMVKPITISGIKQLPSQEEFTILSQLIVEKYGNITLGELQLAFDMNALGTEWNRIEHYNMFSVQFVSDVLRQYIEYSRKAMQDISKKEERKQMKVEERVNIQALHDMLMADKQDENFEKKLRYTAPLIMQSLIKRGYFKDDYISDEWLNEVRYQVKGNLYKIVGEWDRSKYNRGEWKAVLDNEQLSQIKCEVYKHIIKNEELFTTIMNNITADL